MKMSSILFIATMLFCIPANAKSDLEKFFDKLGVKDNVSFTVGIASIVMGAISLKAKMSEKASPSENAAFSGSLFGLGTSLILVSGLESGGGGTIGESIAGQTASAVKFLTAMVGALIGGIFGYGIAEGNNNSQK